MNTWYRTNKYTAEIKPVKVVNSTDKFITIVANNYEFLAAKQDEYFPTFREARTALMNHYSEQHKALLAQAEQVHEKFTKVFMMDEEAKC